MIKPQHFCQYLQHHGISFFAGVPDSLLKNLCAFIDEFYDRQQHVITANEGNAVAMAMGHYLATGNAAVAYMQNSGLGNAINPLTSMACREVSSIPMLLIIGWRGEPGEVDEPQHFKQGKITLELLELMGIPFEILDKDCQFEEKCATLLQVMNDQARPVALVVRKSTFEATVPTPSTHSQKMPRERALEIIQQSVSDSALVIATTGKTARELYEIQVRETGQCKGFLTVGAMGHASSIALAAAMTQPEKQVVCLDGDGAMLMHMGALATVGAQQPSRLVHVLLNNQAHESVGGQPTCIDQIDVKSLALANGYPNYKKIESEEELAEFWGNAERNDGPWFVEIVVAIGSRSDLGRPGPTPLENAQTFLRHAK